MKLRARRLLWDIETNGLLDELDRVHILAIRDLDTLETFVFRRNDKMDTIRQGIRMLNAAEYLTGHNIISFDIPAMVKVYGDEFQPVGIVRDTLVIVRMLFADEKERDYRRHRQGIMDGREIGRQGLEAWGQRLGLYKGDYAKIKAAELKEQFPDLSKEEINSMVWAEWSQDMEDYCVQDLNVNEELWRKIEKVEWSDFAMRLEHSVHELMDRVKANGFPFAEDEARELEAALRQAHEGKSERAKQHFGDWWVAAKWNRVVPKQKNQRPYVIRPEMGEDDSRGNWGDITIPKRSVKYKSKDGVPQKADRTEGCAYCPIELREFNPNSREQIIDRLKTIYGWEPQEFTENNSPVVDDEVLRDLSKANEDGRPVIPICEDLAEIFYYKKRLGQLVDGKNGLLKKAERDGKIHPTINVGGTVTNRASHSDPNIAQVPRVVFKTLKQWEEDGVDYDFLLHEIVYGFRGEDGVFRQDKNLTPLIDPADGKQVMGTPRINKDTGLYEIDEETGKIKTKKNLLKGRAGDHGWDFRHLFYVPEGWVLMGADQKGIELRCLGHFMAEFDNGAYGRLVVDADPHDLHQQVMELDSRDTAKTVIYALIYGAQDYKLGCTIDPSLALYPQKAKALGAEMRRRLMTRIPALGAVVSKVQREARRGFVDGMDGRKLFVRARHAALNTKLQGGAATISKLWCCNFEEFCEQDGLVHGWDGDFVILAWVHDELQVAVRDDPAVREICRRNAHAAAAEAGEAVNFRLPVDIDVKWGERWSDTH